MGQVKDTEDKLKVIQAKFRYKAMLPVKQKQKNRPSLENTFQQIIQVDTY